MILSSKRSGYLDNMTYVLEMDQDEYKKALEGEILYRGTASADVVGEWQVKFKKFSKAKRKRMNLI